MTPQQARASYRRQLSRHGEPVTLRRPGIDGAPNQDFPNVLARLRGTVAQQLAGAVQAGEVGAILLAEDVEASGFPLPFKTKFDCLVDAAGKELLISVVDARTRRIAGVQIGYDLIVAG